MLYALPLKVRLKVSDDSYCLFQLHDIPLSLRPRASVVARSRPVL